MLRQQLIVLRRQVKRPQLTIGGRICLVLLARFTRFWQNTLHIVQPDTLLRRNRDLFRLYWRRESRQGKPKPRIPQETIDLIKRMAAQNRLRGAGQVFRGGRVVGHLLKMKKKLVTRRQDVEKWERWAEEALRELEEEALQERGKEG